MKPEEFLPRALVAALRANHVFPEMAACEAALESAWGTSKLARMANNLFGQKKGQEPYPSISINTREYLAGRWVVVSAAWPVFPDWETSFLERMALLHRNPVYADALKCADGESFVREVSKHWATDPERANKCLQIYTAHKGLFGAHLVDIQKDIDAALDSIPKPELPDGLK